MPRSAASIQTALDNVDAAIARAEEAQSTSDDGTSLTNANLQVLYTRRDTLQAQLDKANGAVRRFTRGVVTGLR